MSDRMVHALLPDGRQIVRYNVLSKWYVETMDGDYLLDSEQITLKEAAHMALDGHLRGGWVYLGKRGGARFDKVYTTLYQQKMAELRKEKS